MGICVQLQAYTATGVHAAATCLQLTWTAAPTTAPHPPCPQGYLCACCAGASGRLLPLDPWVNPSHHLFLTAMERRARGGGPVRLRARRRLDREDPLIATLRAGKVALLAWAAARTLTALLKA